METLSEIQITYSPKREKGAQLPVIKGSEDCNRYFREVWSNRMQHIEEMYLMILNRGNMILGYTKISSGGMNSTVVDPKIIFQVALKAHASGIILAHNHPSGAIKPSEQDLRLTRRISEGAAILDISFLDHLIISSEGYFSFADDGLL